MFQYYIITREDQETIKNIYNKWKSSYLKEDWYQTLLKDLELKREEKCDIKISALSKEQYRNCIRSKIEKAAFNHNMQKK